MFVGRKYELRILRDAIASRRAELGIVYGRRRIGKSTLLMKAMSRKGDLFFEALQNVPQKKQIDHFLLQLAEQTQTPRSLARDWREAFEILTYHIKKRRRLVVLDEFPWMASGRSELVSLLKYFWDNRWKKNAGLTLIICGSIASFMLKHIVHSKALHNRKTFEIKLPPLPAFEAVDFLKKYRSSFEAAKFLMVFGGVPKYLEQIDPRRSFADNMDRLCFQRNGFFVNEFETLFKEQFKVVRTYERIVKVLAHKNRLKQELAERLKIPSGGGFTSYIQNLVQADFIKAFTPQAPFGPSGRKTVKLVLWDEWLRFYFCYMEPNRHLIDMSIEPGLFDKIAGQGINTFLGLNFEIFCMKNLPHILKNIGFEMHQIIGFGPFFRQRERNRPRNEGLQIDILVHRKGRVLTLIECKFSTRPIGTSIISEVERKIKFLRPPRHFTVEKILISGGDVGANLLNNDYFHHIIGIEALFNG